MSAFPGSPRLFKGAIVGIDPLIPVPNVVVFQIQSRHHDPAARTPRRQAEGDRGEAFRLTGAPKETIL